jgi:phosphoribosylformylglycinamidine synthase
MIRRIFIEKRPAYREGTQRFKDSVRDDLGISELTGIRHALRYDVENVSDSIWELACSSIFAEPAVEEIHEEKWEADGSIFAVEYLPGQFDQRADSARQCLALLGAPDPVVRCAEVYALNGPLSQAQIERIKRYRINPVDSRSADLNKSETLVPQIPTPAPVARLSGFRELNDSERTHLHAELGLAMSLEDLAFCQNWFTGEERDPTLTELKLLDTYWSDHCRHTTFLSEITDVKIAEGPLTQPIQKTWEAYLQGRDAVYGKSAESRPICLMDIALLAMKELRKSGRLPALEESEEVNAASIVVQAEIDGEKAEWLVMFKNETHNHPTEIEPFGGAATCLGGAIRDPLSGRSFVYQAMRVTGSGDPRETLAETLPGKLPQRKITVEAAEGYSSYGNQIGLATGMVDEVYHQGYRAKRMEIGAVVAAAPRDQVLRGTPLPGDRIILVGGRTGRDGIGGATGSSKAHTEKALENAAEVQKGDPPMERKLQRLFRDPAVSRSIKRCNDFGAGGISVAIGELADGLEIDLDTVPLKYAGLDGTEIALSESQERMAVVLDPKDVATFIAAAMKENVEAVEVAQVTEQRYLIMRWQGDEIVRLDRDFLDSNGVRQLAKIEVEYPSGKPPIATVPTTGEDPIIVWEANLSDLNVCSKLGLSNRFDSTVGSGTILHPFGGKNRLTPVEAMAAKLPVLQGETATATLMSYGFFPRFSEWSPFHGAIYAVLDSVARVIATGGSLDQCHLTFQEYFERLRNDPRRWGKPFAALLGAYAAQKAMGIAAIGGKDSMSGSFRELDVPPTLVSFALGTTHAQQVISPELKAAGNDLLLLEIPFDDQGIPDWAVARTAYENIAVQISARNILSAGVIREGGIAAALSRMAFGNGIGAQVDLPLADPQWFQYAIGGMLLEVISGAEVVGARKIGVTTETSAICSANDTLPLERLLQAWERPLETVFPTRADTPCQPSPEEHRFKPHNVAKAPTTIARPRVLIPVFPGTNCEYDSARVFEKAGGFPHILVFRNGSLSEIEDSLIALEQALDAAQILMLPGGFSAGDEPGGSGKFIATVFRNSRVADATMRLHKDRKGLILGICNGFQALVKLGLLPFGEIRQMQAHHPSLTTNSIGRHISGYVRTRVVSTLSPWLSACHEGDIFMTPVSHGEGRFTADENIWKSLYARHQIATQYVDESGSPTHALPENPNGSVQGIEGITSPCGRIFGKMGHSERVGPYIGKNIPGKKEQPLFEGGVRYFTD